MSARGEDGLVVSVRPALTASSTLSITKPEGEEIFADEWTIRHNLEIWLWNAHEPVAAPAQKEQ
jgi:hypothetical protein